MTTNSLPVVQIWGERNQRATTCQRQVNVCYVPEGPKIHEMQASVEDGADLGPVYLKHNKRLFANLSFTLNDVGLFLQIAHYSTIGRKLCSHDLNRSPVIHRRGKIKNG